MSFENNLADDFMSSSIRTVQFEMPGDTVTGIVLAPPERRLQLDEDGQVKKFKDGTPRVMYRIRLLTELRDPTDSHDDGERVIYVKWLSHKAVVTAVRAAGAEAILPGGILTLTMTGFGKKENPKFNPPKFWHAVYVPPEGDSGFMNAAPSPQPVTASPVTVTAQVVQPTARPNTESAVMQRLREQQQRALNRMSSSAQSERPPF